MTVKRTMPYIWVTWLSKVMAGEQSCIWASWFKTKHEGYDKVPSDFNAAQWKLEHTRLLTDFALERQRQGDQVYIEGQNRFKYKRQSGLILAGIPDVIGKRSDGVAVYDMKTGSPRTSDQVQVMIYMYCLPRCMDEYRDVQLDGCVVYRTHQVPIPAATIDDRFSDNLHHFLNMLEADFPALKVPSARECHFCEITKADCSERIDAPLAEEDEEETDEST